MSEREIKKKEFETISVEKRRERKKNSKEAMSSETSHSFLKIE